MSGKNETMLHILAFAFTTTPNHASRNVDAVRYRYRKGGKKVTLEDVGSRLGNIWTHVSRAEAVARGTNLDEFVGWLKENGAKPIRRRKRRTHFVYYD